MIKCIGADNVMFVFTEEQLADLKKVVYFIETQGFVFYIICNIRGSSGNHSRHSHK